MAGALRGRIGIIAQLLIDLDVNPRQISLSQLKSGVIV